MATNPVVATLPVFGAGRLGLVGVLPFSSYSFFTNTAARHGTKGLMNDQILMRTFNNNTTRTTLKPYSFSGLGLFGIGAFGITTIIQGVRNKALCSDVDSDEPSNVPPARPTQTTTPTTTSTYSINSSIPRRTSPPNGGGFPGLPPNYRPLVVGSTMGFISGYFVKKASKVIAITVGAAFVLIQVLDSHGYHLLDDMRETYTEVLDVDRDGRVTERDLKEVGLRVLRFLKMNFHADASFLIGFGFGFILA